MAIWLSDDTVATLKRTGVSASTPAQSPSDYAGVDAAVPTPAPYTPEAPISDGLGHTWNSATQAWDNSDGTPYQEIQSYPQPALADYGGGFGGFAGQQVYETPDYQIPPPTVPWGNVPTTISSGQGQFYDTWMPTATGYEALPDVRPSAAFPQQQIGPFQGDFEAGRNQFMDTLAPPARRLYEQGLDWEDPQLLNIARQPGQANPWDLLKPFDYMAEVGADVTPQIADTLPGNLANVYRLGDKLLENAGPLNPLGINPPDLPTSDWSRREVAGDIRDPGAALDEFNQRPWYEKLAAGAVFDPLNAVGVGKADEAVDLARAVGRYGDDLGRGALRVGDEFGQAMGRSMQDVGQLTGLGPGLPVEPRITGMRYSPRPADTPISKLPVIRTEDQLRNVKSQAAGAGDRLFVRWSGGPDQDLAMGGRSLNTASRPVSMEGLSAWHLGESDGATRTAVLEYASNYIGESNRHAWLARADIVGPGPDGEPLIANWEPVARLSKKLVQQFRDEQAQLAEEGMALRIEAQQKHLLPSWGYENGQLNRGDYDTVQHWRELLGRAREAITGGEEGAVDLGPLVDVAQRAGTRLFGDAAAREGRPVAGGIYDTIAPTEKVGRGLLRQYEGAMGTAGLELRKVLDEGNALLRQAGVKGTFDGTSFKVAANQTEVDDLYAALHGEGPVPPKLQDVYDYIKREVAVESQASEEAAQALGKNFIPNDDYFYRGWKSPKVTHAGAPNFGATPGYQKPRVDATYRELRAAGYEPASWNPIEMLALRRQAGVQWREQQELLAGLKETGQAMPLSQAKDMALDNWRVPQVGPAFEGRPRAYIPDAGAGNLADEASRAAVAYSDPIAVPNADANTLEGIFGKRPDFGVGNIVLSAGQALKKNKLLASLFQQVDFAGRTLGALTASAVDELAEVAISTAKLHPVEATKHAYQAGRKLVKVPPTIAKLIASNVSGGYQKALRDEILSGKSIVKSRPGISLRGISEAGGKFGEDITMVTRDVRKELRDAVAKGPPSWLGKAHDATTGHVTRNIGRLNAAAQRGLFDGVYVLAQKTGAENFIVPRLVRQHADWTDQQIMAAAADELNKMYSTLGRYQTWIQNPIVNELARGFIFSTNETEALLRGAASTVIGPNKRLWTEFYLGTFLSLAGSAALIHKASTGEWLPTERLNPISKDDFGPLPISYNSRFLAPDIPLKGRNGTRLSLDLVGQMDTAFRLLDPLSFVQSRENVLPRAATTQLSGKSFFGEDVGGFKGRLAHAAADLFEPIGAQQARGVAGVGPGLAEGRIGQAGYAIQAAGLNVRGESSAMLRDRKAQERYGRDWEKLEPFERKAILDSDPTFKSELDTRKDEAFQQGQEWAEQSKRMDAKKQEYADRQGSLNSALAERTLSPQQWRDRRGDLITEKRGAMDVLTADFEPRKPEEQTAIDRYFAAVDQFTTLEKVDWDRVEGWLAAQPEADRGYIDRNLGLNATAKEKEYRADMKAIADSKYWDIGDRVTQVWAKEKGLPELGQQEMRDYLESEVYKRLRAQAQTDKEAQLLTDEVVDRILNEAEDLSGKVRRAFRDKYPEVTDRLIKWGYKDPGMDETLGIIARDRGIEPK